MVRKHIFFGLATGTATVPDQVTGLVSTSLAQTAIGLSWAAPPDGGSAIVNYLVEYRTGTAPFAAFAHTASTATSLTVTGLSASTPYDLRVSAINGVGTGAPMDLAVTTPSPGPVALDYDDTSNMVYLTPASGTTAADYGSELIA